jgi:hypothetical protein
MYPDYSVRDLSGCHSGCCVSAVLWHAVHRRIGTPIFRLPDFEGKPTLEAHLATDGLYADVNQPFHGEGLIVLDTHCGQRVAYGLASPSASPEPWSSDLTENALRLICDAQNDASNSFAYLLSDARTTLRGQPTDPAPAGVGQG